MSSARRSSIAVSHSELDVLAEDVLQESRTALDFEKKKKKKRTGEVKKKKSFLQKSHKHRHHHKKESLGSSYDQCDGVTHVILTEEVQQLLKCLVGENVTAEKPWTHISKFYIQEQVESDDVPEEFLTFLSHKSYIVDYPNDYMMIGYIPDESRDYDEFYFCLTTEAEEAVSELVKLVELKQQARLENTINKRVGDWDTMGSHAEIEEGWLTNTRGYYMIEFEARYPIIYSDVKFRFRTVEDARDGYVELKMMPRYLVPIIHKKRIDSSTQVAPAVTDNVAQTFCSYPRNAWTQYEYQVQFVENLTKEFMESFKNFTNSRMDGFDGVLSVNEDINFYSNDYVELINQKIPTLFEGLYQEYQSFDDVKRCKDKMISALCWHPMWTGVVAIAYADISPRWYQMEKRDTNLMEEVVHGFNPILIWSFKDTLNPKLTLETNSEVHCLSFCPQDPNLLIGGCANGQIILWDIKNKLNKVETEEVLTPAQQTYRTRLYSEMAWMKNTRDYSIVPPTAFSQLFHSHMNNVSGIQWLHPLYEMPRTGKVQPKKDIDEPSLQFVTSSSDGTLKFWNLRQKPVMVGDYKPQRKSRRLGKRPSALTLDVSPYRILNRRLVPHYELEVFLPNTERLCPVASISIPSDRVKYQESNPDPNRTFSMSERIMYEPIYTWPKKPVMPLISLGTYTGDFMLCSWEGYEYSSGDDYTKEEIKFVNIGKYHDGPVLTCERHPHLEDVYLSIGGKIFCIWLDKLKGKPVIWRRSRNKYTHGHWDVNKCSGFRLTTSDGSREFWNLDFKSEEPYSTQMYSGKPLLEAQQHPLPMKNQFVGIADDRGTFRLIYTKFSYVDSENSISEFLKFLNNNANRKLEFEAWQTTWTASHASWIQEQMEAELAEQARLRAEEQERQVFEEEKHARETSEEAKREAAKQHAPPGKYEEWARERWIIKEQERMGNELLSNKRLDKETLMRQQAPLKRLEIEAARKQQKIKQRLMKVDEIFMETIAMLFPNLAENREIEDKYAKLVYTEDQISDMYENFITGYQDILVESNNLIENNPFLYELDWKRILPATKARKLKEEFRYSERHSDRYKKAKNTREYNMYSYSPTTKVRIKEPISSSDEDEISAESEHSITELF